MAGAGGQEVGRISVRVVPDTDRFRQELRAQLDELDTDVSVNVDLDSAGAMDRFRILMAQLRADAAGGIDVDVDTRRVGRASSDLQTISRQADAASSSFLGLSRTGLTVTAVMGLAAPAIGLVGGVLAGLPSLLAAAGAGAGTIAVGMDGIKKAASGLKPQFDALKTSISGTFTQDLTPVFQQLGAVFPVLQTGMTQLAHSLSGLFASTVSDLTSPQGLGQLQTILANTGALLSALQPTVARFTQTFLTLAASGSGSFGLLAGVLDRFSASFNTMVGRISSDGALSGAMQGLAQTLDGLLNLFTRLVEAGVGAMGQLGGPLNTLLTGLGDALVAAMPALTAFSGALGSALGALGTALAPIITALTPALQTLSATVGSALTQAFTVLSPALTAVASALNTGLLSALNAIGPVMPQLITAFGQLASALGGALATILAGIAPVLPVVVQSFTQFALVVAGVLTQALVAIQPYLPQLMTAFQQLLVAVIPLVPLLVQLALQALAPLIPALAQLLPSITQLIGMFAQVLTAAQPVIAVFLEMAGVILGTLVGALVKLIGFIADQIAQWTAAQQSVANFVTAAIGKIAELLAQVGLIPGQVQAALSGMGTTLVQAGKDLIQGLINGIMAKIGEAVAAVHNAASQVADAAKSALGIHSPSTVFAGFGENISLGLAGGIAAQEDQAVKAAKHMSDAVKKVFDDFGNLIGVKDFGTKVDDALDQSGFANLPQNFALATGQQAMQDLGISGNGALEQLFTQGAQYIFNVGSVDEALQAQQTAQNKQALQYIRR